MSLTSMFKWAMFRQILLPSSGNVNDYVQRQLRLSIFEFYISLNLVGTARITKTIVNVMQIL